MRAARRLLAALPLLVLLLLLSTPAPPPAAAQAPPWEQEPPTAPPTITSITPAYGPATGGTMVTIKGSGFSTEENAARFVEFGGTPQFTDVRCEDASTCTAKSIALSLPPGWAEGSSIAAEVNGVRGPFGPAFSWYGRPILDRLNPTRGPEAGGNQVRLEGSAFPAAGQSFPGPVTVTFGGTPIERANGCQNGDACTVPAPRGAPGSTVEVTITTPGGTSNARQYTYEAEPSPQPMTITGRIHRILPPLVSEGQIDRQVVPVPGATVEALVGSTRCGSAVSDTEGRFQLTVAAHPATAGCGREGATVTLWVNGTATGDPLPFRSGSSAAVELRPADPQPPPTRWP